MTLQREGYPPLFRVSDPYISLSITEPLALYHDREGKNFYVFAADGQDVTNEFTILRGKKCYAISRKKKV